MPQVIFKLEEQFSDLRSNEIALKFIVENPGTVAIELHSITPRIPDDVRLLEIKDPSFVALKARHEEICAQLTQLLGDHIFLTSDAWRARFIEEQRRSLEEVLGANTNALWSFFRAYGKILSGSFTQRIKKQLDDKKVYAEKVESYRQGVEAFDRWISDAGEPYVKNLYSAKLDQLKDIESDMGADIESSSLATIEPESFFAQTYVLKFARYRWDPKKHSIAIEGIYSQAGNEKRHVGSATTSLLISPKPLLLTICAMASSILGVIVKNAVGAPAKAISFPLSGADVTSALTSAESVGVGLQCVVSSILALTFFNIYEFTDIGKKLGVGVGWRSALLIGISCGLLHERILAAVKALVGG